MCKEGFPEEFRTEPNPNAKHFCTYDLSAISHIRDVKERLGEYAKSKIGYSLVRNSEIFADYLSFDITHHLAIQQRFSNADIAFMLKGDALLYPEGLKNYLAKKEESLKKDPHPPMQIRNNGVVGQFYWFYCYGLNLKISRYDHIYVPIDERISF